MPVSVPSTRRGRSKWEPELAALSPARVAYLTPEPTVCYLVSRPNIVWRRNKWEPELATALCSGYAARLKLDVPSAKKDGDNYDNNNDSHDGKTVGDQKDHHRSG